MSDFSTFWLNQITTLKLLLQDQPEKAGVILPVIIYFFIPKIGGGVDAEMVEEVGVDGDEVVCRDVSIIRFRQPQCHFGRTVLWRAKDIVGTFERPGLGAVVFAAVGDHGGGVDLAQAAVTAADTALTPVLRIA